MSEEQRAGGAGANGEGFHWTRSENSFSFGFHVTSQPDDNTPVTTATQQQQQPAQGQDTEESGSGFAFNFHIPAGKPETPQTVMLPTGGPAQSSELPPTSKAKKKKKKGGGGRGGDGGRDGDGQQEQTNKTAGGETEHREKSTELTPEQQLGRELDWCIEQLEFGLMTQKSTPKQNEEATRALRTLRSSKAPLAKKRQVMRGVAGDYRHKMDEEREQQFRQIQSAVTSARVKAVSEPTRKPVFHRRAGPSMRTAHTHTAHTPHETHGPTHTSAQGQGETEGFVFTQTQEEFCFNFL